MFSYSLPSVTTRKVTRVTAKVWLSSWLHAIGTVYNCVWGSMFMSSGFRKLNLTSGEFLHECIQVTPTQVESGITGPEASFIPDCSNCASSLP